MRNISLRCKIIFAWITLIGAILCLSFPVLAQSVGDACSTAGEYVSRNISGTYTMMICDGTNYQEMITSTDGTANINFANDTGACGSAKTGRLRYNSGSDTWEYCDGSNWTTF